MSDTHVSALIYGLLGTGGATFLWTIARSYIALRESAEGREDKAVKRLEKFEESCRRQLAAQRAWGTHWYNRAAMLERELLLHGITPPRDPHPPALPPSDSRL